MKPLSPCSELRRIIADFHTSASSLSDEQQPKPLTLFCAYAPKRELLQQELGKHLHLLQRQGLISTCTIAKSCRTEWTLRLIHIWRQPRSSLAHQPRFSGRDYSYGIRDATCIRRISEAKPELSPFCCVLLIGEVLLSVNYKRSLERDTNNLLENRDKAFSEIAGSLVKYAMSFYSRANNNG